MASGGSEELDIEDPEQKRAELIIAVKARPILYNIISNSNRNKYLKESNWREVAEEIGKSGTFRGASNFSLCM
jgi:hypothetical protein